LDAACVCYSLYLQQTEKMLPISIFLRIQCSPLEILGFHRKFFVAIICYQMLSFAIFCYHLLFFQTPQVSTHTIGSLLLLRHTAAVAAMALRLQFTPSALPLLRCTAAAPQAAAAAIAICNCCICPLAAQPK
jgi:hypothetical protein